MASGVNYTLLVRDRLVDVSYKARLVLYALAARADADGRCWPSLETLCRDTSLSRSGVLRGLDELTSKGRIEGDRTCWWFVVPAACEEIARWRPNKMPKGSVRAVPGEAGGASEGCRQGGGVINRQCQVETESVKLKRPRECQVETLECQVETRSVKLTPEVYKEVGREVRQYVSVGEGGGVVDNSVRRDYRALFGKAGWRPSDQADRMAAERLCYDLGATAEEAKAFGYHNSVRRWCAVTETCTVADLARRWVEVFRMRSPSVWEYEQNRRKSDDRVMT